MPLIPDLVIVLTLHSVIACASVEGVIRALGVRTPATRIALRDLALILPIAFAPLSVWLAPWRTSDAFLEQALFVSQRFDRFAIAGLPFRQAMWWACAIVGAVLLVRDLRVRPPRTHGPGQLPGVQEDSGHAVAVARDTVARLSERLGVTPPIVHVIPSERPLMHIEGAWPRHLRISTATLATLPDAQLETAIAHELAHLVTRDLRRSVLLLPLRLVLVASPLAHITARRQHQEIEWRADDAAAGLTGRPVALARALVASGRAASGDYLGLLGQGRLEMLERRCRRLVNGEYGIREPHRLPLSLTALGLLATMCLVS